ncbi:U-box domain-containing protein 33-like isoform X2 [Cucumis melo var. makuwa]|uniref:RING-type E3 ubiquitin transferase n=2 Tax=Cucumis melo TaxID=3656 RepID=A0A5A7U5Q8_CUCMM|nr:U-box domain-containing protein 33-like isoform X2 [Cucumis melo]KAA0048965.1 U-box domain-containing protein 33-like isoform X2 [Cucumis melo var. makuwa]
MAVVSAVQATTPRVGPINYAEASPIMISSSREIVEEPVGAVSEDIIYVAVGKDVKECLSVLRYALKSSRGKKICLLHVHVPAQMIPLMGTKFPANSLEKEEVKAYHEFEKQNLPRVMNEYILYCLQEGVHADKLCGEAKYIEKGIVDMISLHRIDKLVMGAAVDKCYSRKMVDLKSKKAIYVRSQAPAFCHIEFICKGNLICTREGISDEAQVETIISSPQISPDAESSEVTHRRSQSLPLGQDNSREVGSPSSSLRPRGRSLLLDHFRGNILDPSSPDIRSGVHAARNLEVNEAKDEWGLLTRRSPSERSENSTRSPRGVIDMAPSPFFRVELCANGLEDGNTSDNLYNQCERVMMEAANARREAFLEAIARRKSEKETVNALHRVRVAEGLYAEELKQRKEVEQELAKEKAKLESIKTQLNEEMEELRIAQDQKASLERDLLEADLTAKELEQKILSAVELLQSYKREREELQIQRDNALREAEELRENQSTGRDLTQFFTEFPFREIEEATKNFDPSLKIGEGGYGSIFRGNLRHTMVAIKILHSDSSQGPSEFQQEVNVLSKMRHPNLVTLIGACPEAWVLIYEYLCNGSLEDRLSCKDNTPPLSWQIRIRIATELCSALMFLHSSKPHSIIHGDLKPANVLLDANFVCKLGDFGICRLLSRDEMLNSETLVWRTDNPKGTFAYMDPEFLSSGELTTKSDVYSFGIILLRLLTGRSAMGISKEVQYAMANGNLESILDPLAGDWPFVQAEQLARLALRCCDMKRKSRPDLITDVWRVLGPMRASCGGRLSIQLGSAEHSQPPSYFICPIFQEVMQDPHVAADGYTYEAEAMRGWLDSGHDTSPMTNLKLEHRNLVPNRALRSAIQEWLHHN